MVLSKYSYLIMIICLQFYDFKFWSVDQFPASVKLEFSGGGGCSLNIFFWFRVPFELLVLLLFINLTSDFWHHV